MKAGIVTTLVIAVPAASRLMPQATPTLHAREGGVTSCVEALAIASSPVRAIIVRLLVKTQVTAYSNLAHQVAEKSVKESEAAPAVPGVDDRP